MARPPHEILRFLTRVRRLVVRHALATAALLAIAGALVVITLAAMMAGWSARGDLVAPAAVILGLAGLVAGVALLTRRLLRMTGSPLRVARTVARRVFAPDPGLFQELLGALELWLEQTPEARSPRDAASTRAPSGSSPALARSYIEDVCHR
ncbi:MAG: hypothetical protein KC468_38480, partial [Myxococcales bacterium]|nr:hypothetical protein [Myxococcales bacterium]